MRHVVLDTNALIQALPSRSRYHKIWTDFLAGRYSLCVSNEILSEYEEICEHIITTTKELTQWIEERLPEKKPSTPCDATNK